MSFTFEFVGARHDGGSPQCPTPTLRLIGRLLEGCIHMDDPIVVPTCEGDQMAVVLQFWETFYDWLALPFYHTLTPETMPEPFCLLIHGFPTGLLPLCPGVARSPQKPSPNPTLQRTAHGDGVLFRVPCPLAP